MSNTKSAAVSAAKRRSSAASVNVPWKVTGAQREEGAALADGGDVYDALLDDYEPGATAAQLSEMFGALRPRLVGLQLAPLVQVPQHVAFAAALHHEEVALRRGDPREEADDVLVLQPLVVLHLPL